MSIFSEDVEMDLTSEDITATKASSVVSALGRMLCSGALADVTLSARGACVRAHRLVLASCSQYFAQLFKEVESENNTLVVVLGCDVAELRLLLTFMYTGEVTASKKALPSLLRLAQTLQVSGLTDADTNSSLSASEPEGAAREHSSSPINLGLKPDADAAADAAADDAHRSVASKPDDACSPHEAEVVEPFGMELMARQDNDRLSKLDLIVRNLYTSHKIGHPAIGTPPPPNTAAHTADSRKYRLASSVCSVCNKRLSNQYNLRVHMETHAGRRHACRACAHVSRSRDALRKHVAYRHATPDLTTHF